jgi:hypothetical protein
VGVGHTNTKGNTLAAEITFCHGSAPPSCLREAEDKASAQSNGTILADFPKKIKCFLQPLQKKFLSLPFLAETLVFFSLFWYDK